MIDKDGAATKKKKIWVPHSARGFVASSGSQWDKIKFVKVYTAKLNFVNIINYHSVRNFAVVQTLVLIATISNFSANFVIVQN